MFGYRPGLLLADFQINTYTFTPTTVATQILGAQPDRYSLIWWTSTPQAFWVAPVLKPLASQVGMLTIQNNPPIVTFKDYGPVVCLPWFAIGAVGAIQTAVTEVLYRPKGGESSVAKISTLADTIMGASVTPELATLLPKYVAQVPTVPPLSYPARRSGPYSFPLTPMSR